MKVDVDNAAKNQKNIWRPIHSVIHTPFISETNISPLAFLGQCKNDPNENQFLSSEVKVVLKHFYGTRVISTSGDDPSKVF